MIFRTIRKHPLITYFILANFWTWLFWIPTMFQAYPQGLQLPVPITDLIRGRLTDPQQVRLALLFAVAVYGPLLAALLVTVITEGRRGLRDWVRRIFHWRVGIQWYALVFLLPLVINVATGMVGFMISGTLPDIINKPNIPWAYFLPYILYEIVTSGLEEPGWRGFALPRLQRRYTAEDASWLLGLLWSIWHYPFYIYLNWKAGFFPVLSGMAGFTMSIIGWGIILTWVYNNTRSIGLLILLHAWANVVNMQIINAFQNPLIPIIQALVTWGLVILIQKRYGTERLTHTVEAFEKATGRAGAG